MRAPITLTTTHRERQIDVTEQVKRSIEQGGVFGGAPQREPRLTVLTPKGRNNGRNLVKILFYRMNFLNNYLLYGYILLLS